MPEYIVYASALVPAREKRELPNIIYNYIADDSHIGYHYTITLERENAYLFVESELEHAKFIADAWGMKIKQIDAV